MADSPLDLVSFNAGLDEQADGYATTIVKP